MNELAIRPDQTVEYDVAGDGPPVILVPGLGCRRTVWSDIAAALSDHFRVYSYDLRGYAGVAPPEAFDITDLADDLRRFTEALGLQHSYLFGHSEGGFIAIELALARPDLVRGMILAASAAYTDEYGRELLRNWRRIGEHLGADGLGRELMLWSLSPVFMNERTRELRMLQALAARSPINLPAYFRHNTACETHEARDRLRGSPTATLLLGGTLDIIMTLRHNILLHQLLPNSRLVTLERLGHHLFLEDSRAVLGHVTSFLQAVEGGALK